MPRLYIVASDKLRAALDKSRNSDRFSSTEATLVVCPEMSWERLRVYVIGEASTVRPEVLRVAGHAMPCFGAEIKEYQRRLPDREAELRAALITGGIDVMDLQVWAFHHEQETCVQMAVSMLLSKDWETKREEASFWKQLHDALTGDAPTSKPTEARFERISVLKHRAVRPFLALNVRLQAAREPSAGQGASERDAQSFQTGLEQARGVLDEATWVTDEVESGFKRDRAQELLTEARGLLDATPELRADAFQIWLRRLDDALNELRETVSE